MGGFNASWFIAVGVGVALVAADLLLPDNHKQKLGRWLLVVAVLCFAIGLSGLIHDGYVKWFKKAGEQRQLSERPVTTERTTSQPVAQKAQFQSISKPRKNANEGINNKQKPIETQAVPLSNSAPVSAAPAQVPGTTVNNCPNGICISGGTVDHPSVTNINPLPVITASAQTQSQTDNPKRPWKTQFFIQASGQVMTGTLRLLCSGPVLVAGIGRINPFSFSSGSNGPDPSDPNTAVYELSPEPLEPNKKIPVEVYSLSPISVISGTIGSNVIHFPN